jgi:diaminopropionate ammonia-lyase
MSERIKATQIKENQRFDSVFANRFRAEEAIKVRRFHKSFPAYSPTPLHRLNHLAAHLGVKDIYIKDESLRFHLNAFKSLGSSYCVGAFIAEKLGKSIDDLSYETIISKEVKDRLGELTFVTATDGNHGRGVAWTANLLGMKSVVYMPKGSAKERLENIRACGADASVTEMNYNDTVRYAKKMAEENGWILIQDTAWDGYENIPTWIMQGYTTMALEAAEQLAGERPTHVFLQAGVGSMAGAAAGFFADYYRDGRRPIVTIVEPNEADCFYKTALKNDGSLQVVDGDMDTIMAGLACGEPCTIAWDVLKQYGDNFVSMPDFAAAKGMRVLGNPLEDDPRIVSGESGASTLGLVAESMQNDRLDWLRNLLGLDDKSVILCFSTEGDTDQRNYRSIVWDGLHPNLNNA